MVVNLSKILQQKADVLQSLRERTKAYLSKWGYSQKQMASAVGISETYLSDFLNGRRGMPEVPFAKIEQVLSVNATQRKLQFYTGGNTGARMCNLQARGKNLWRNSAKQTQWQKGTHIFGDVLAVATPSATPEILVASTHLLLPTILQVTVPLGLGVRAAAWQLRIEVPNLRKAQVILFLHEGEHLFPN